MKGFETREGLKKQGGPQLKRKTILIFKHVSERFTHTVKLALLPPHVFFKDSFTTVKLALDPPHVIAPPRKPPKQDMGHRAKAYSDIHGFYRGREEHLYGILWPFGIFRGKWRGRGATGEHRLWSRVKVLLNFVNFAMRRRVLYEPMGPWSHFPVFHEDGQDAAADGEVGDEFDGDPEPEHLQEEEEEDEAPPQPRKLARATRVTRHQQASAAAEMGLSSQQLFSLRNDQ